jgi:hypothetical protein
MAYRVGIAKVCAELEGSRRSTTPTTARSASGRQGSRCYRDSKGYPGRSSRFAPRSFRTGSPHGDRRLGERQLFVAPSVDSQRAKKGSAPANGSPLMSLKLALVRSTRAACRFGATGRQNPAHPSAGLPCRLETRTIPLRRSRTTCPWACFP